MKVSLLGTQEQPVQPRFPQLLPSAHVIHISIPLKLSGILPQRKKVLPYATNSNNDHLFICVSNLLWM